MKELNPLLHSQLGQTSQDSLFNHTRRTRGIRGVCRDIENVSEPLTCPRWQRRRHRKKRRWSITPIAFYRFKHMFN